MTRLTEDIDRLVLEIVFRGDATKIRDDECVRVVVVSCHLGVTELKSGLRDELIPLVAKLRVVFELVVSHT